MKVLAAAILALLALALPAGAVASAPTTVDLGTAAPFAVFATSQITDVPTSTINGNVGLTPAAGSFITGLTCSEVTGVIFDTNGTGPAPCDVMNPGLLTTLNSDVTAAYGDAAGRIPDVPDITDVSGDNQLGGKSLGPGVYRFPDATTANLIGNLTLAGNADAVWIFQATDKLVTASSSTVTLTGGAQACNVFWQVSSAATLGSSSTLVGTVLAHDDIVVQSAVTVAGRLLAGDQGAGEATLISDTITAPTTCVTQASINATAAAAAAAAQAQAQAAAAAQAAIVAQQAAAQAAIAAAAANAKAAAAAAALAASEAATAAKAAAAARVAAQHATAVREKAAVAKAAAVKAARAARLAQTAAAKARTAARKAAAKAAARAIARRRAAVPKPIGNAGFTG